MFGMGCGREGHWNFRISLLLSSMGGAGSVAQDPIPNSSHGGGGDPANQSAHQPSVRICGNERLLGDRLHSSL